SHFLAGRVMGDQDSTVVNACSRAAYGVPGSVNLALPLAISTCEFQSYTGANVPDGIPGTAVDPPVGPPPGYGGGGRPDFPPAYAGWKNKPLHELYVMTHGNGDLDPCAFKGKDTNGGFGWLDDSSNCSTNLQLDSTGQHYWAEILTGSAPPNPCRDRLPSLRGTVIDVPVFDCLVKQAPLPTGGADAQSNCAPQNAGGAKTWYHVAGFAKFYLSGYSFPGA